MATRTPYRVTVHEGRNTRVTTIRAATAREALRLAIANGADVAEYGTMIEY